MPDISPPQAKRPPGRAENLKPIRDRARASLLGRKGAAARTERFRLRRERVELAIALAGSGDLALQHSASLTVLLQSIDASLIAEANLNPIRPKRIEDLARVAGLVAKLLGVSAERTRSQDQASGPGRAPVVPRLAEVATAAVAGPIPLPAAPAPPEPPDPSPLEAAPLD